MIILVLYCLVLIMGVTVDPLTLENNLVRKIDLALLGENHVYHGYGLPFDPEGLLSTLGSIGNVMFGYILARKIAAMDSRTRQIQYVFFFGAILITLVLFGILRVFPSTSLYGVVRMPCLRQAWLHGFLP